MDLQKIGEFLAGLRRERGLTQAQLGEQLGVSNKTVSRWEKGNYLPPAEMLRELSTFYGISINEILSAQLLGEEQYRQRAEENIAAAVESGEWSRRQLMEAWMGWLRKSWWVPLGCLIPGIVVWMMLPHVVQGSLNASVGAAALIVFGAALAFHHGLFHVSSMSGREDRWKLPMRIRFFWLAVLGIMAFLCVELGLAALFALTPAGNADGYAIGSMFYDVLIEDGGIYPDRCFEAFRRTAWQGFLVLVVNLDLAALWMKKN